MAQRRNSSGRGDELSDLEDVKALAAKARQETGGPVLKPNASELSGLRPRRDSVVGMRLTPPPRATSSELPNWFWGVLGCLSVLLVGFAALFVLGRAGTLGPLLGETASLVAPAPSPPVPAAPAPSPSPEPVVKVPERAAPAEHVAERPTHEGHLAAIERAAAAERAATREPAAAPAPENAAPAEAASVEKRPAPSAVSPKARAAKTSDPAPAADQDDSAGGETPEAKAPAAAPASRAARAAAPAPKAGAADDSDDQDSLPGQDDVERALDALSSKVRGCFVKYQIKGTARVRLVAMPAGKADSVNVTGDFEDTPTGLCVEAVINDAKLPTFKGPPLKLSQSYQLR